MPKNLFAMPTVLDLQTKTAEGKGEALKVQTGATGGRGRSHKSRIGKKSFYILVRGSLEEEDVVGEETGGE